MDPTDRETADVRAALERAGWHQGRNQAMRAQAWSQQLDSPGGFEVFSVALAALAEFGGIEISLAGPGTDFAKGSFLLDPMLAAGEEDRFARVAAALRTRLYPLGEAYEGNAFLAIGEDGEVYLLKEDAMLLGRSIREGLAALILGRRFVA